MEKSMIEHGIGFKIITTIGQGLMWILVAFGFQPAFEFVILQVDQHVFINPLTKVLLDELKQILGILTMLFVLVKILIDIKKLRNEKK